jgi:hypothetical protein
MNPTAIYVRTEKGAAEVAQRSNAIPAKARSLLLLIDGKLNGAQLLDKFSVFPNSAEFLQQLEELGFIAAQGGAATPAPAAAAPSAPAPVAAAAPAAAAHAAGTGGPRSIAEAKRVIVRTLHDVLGPEADFLTEKIEAAMTVAELRKHAEKYRDMLVDMGKPKKSAAYWEAFEAALPEE